MTLKITWSITPHLTNQKPIVIYIAVGFNQKLFKKLIMKTKIKQFLKFLFVIGAPLVALIYYVAYITEIFSKSPLIICLCTFGLFLVFFNAVFYSFHMSKTKLFSRWSATIFKGFGLMVAIDEDTALVIVIGCFGLTFRYTDLFTKERPKGNHFKPENRF